MSGSSRGRYVGVDLALPRSRRTGVCLLDAENKTYETWVIGDGVVDFVNSLEPSLVCIDAPLGLPAGGHNRLVESRARRIGLRLLPPLLGAMRELTIHGIEVSRRLRAMGYRVLEVHPSSTLRLLGLSMGEFIDGLATILRGPLVLSEDEADSLVAAYTCYLAYLGLTEEIHGLEGEGYLVIPRPGLSHPLRAFKCVVARGLDDGCW